VLFQGKAAKATFKPTTAGGKQQRDAGAASNAGKDVEVEDPFAAVKARAAKKKMKPQHAQ
jgi:hypothetical protein